MGLPRNAYNAAIVRLCASSVLVLVHLGLGLHVRHRLQTEQKSGLQSFGQIAIQFSCSAVAFNTLWLTVLQLAGVWQWQVLVAYAWLQCLTFVAAFGSWSHVFMPVLKKTYRRFPEERCLLEILVKVPLLEIFWYKWAILLTINLALSIATGVTGNGWPIYMFKLSSFFMVWADGVVGTAVVYALNSLVVEHIRSCADGSEQAARLPARQISSPRRSRARAQNPSNNVPRTSSPSCVSSENRPPSPKRRTPSPSGRRSRSLSPSRPRGRRSRSPSPSRELSGGRSRDVVGARNPVDDYRRVSTKLRRIMFLSFFFLVIFLPSLFVAVLVEGPQNREETGATWLRGTHHDQNGAEFAVWLPFGINFAVLIYTAANDRGILVELRECTLWLVWSLCAICSSAVNDREQFDPDGVELENVKAPVCASAELGVRSDSKRGVRLARRSRLTFGSRTTPDQV